MCIRAEIIGAVVGVFQAHHVVLADGASHQQVGFRAVVTTALFGLEVVIHRRQLESGQFGADADKAVFQAIRRGYQELIRPTVEGMLGGQRGLEGHQAVIRAQHFLCHFTVTPAISAPTSAKT